MGSYGRTGMHYSDKKCRCLKKKARQVDARLFFPFIFDINFNYSRIRKEEIKEKLPQYEGKKILRKIRFFSLGYFLGPQF